MNTRTLAIILGVALAVSVAVNLFAATAAYTVMNRQHEVEQRADDRRDGGDRPSPRELIAALPPETRETVKQAMRAAGLRARPDFQASREARRQAVLAAAADPYDPARVEALLDQSRASEIAGREKLEADSLAILATLSPAHRAAFAEILDAKRRGDGGGRRDRGGPERPAP